MQYYYDPPTFCYDTADTGRADQVIKK